VVERSKIEPLNDVTKLNDEMIITVLQMIAAMPIGMGVIEVITRA
jgi:hypothetical protein